MAISFKDLFFLCFMVSFAFLSGRAAGQTCPDENSKQCEDKAGNKPSFLNTDSVDHQPWDHLLKKYVSEGWVSYALWKKDQKGLDDYLEALQKPAGIQVKSWTQPEQMAFYINAYNAYTIKLLLNHYPVKSIKEINNGIFQKGPWKVEIVRLLHEVHHLDWLEHEALRLQFKDPRVHAAIHCASKGCPKLQSFAFVGEKLDEQLTRVMREFVNDPFRNNYKAEKNKAVISEIFKWFQRDFDPPGVKAYLTRYADDGIKQLLQNPNLQFDYAYDWSLNERP